MSGQLDEIYGSPARKPVLKLPVQCMDVILFLLINCLETRHSYLNVFMVLECHNFWKQMFLNIFHAASAVSDSKNSGDRHGPG